MLQGELAYYRPRRSGLTRRPRNIIDAMTSRACFLEPMLCRAVSELPQGPAWSYELKFDGYRGLGLRTERRSRLFSRNGRDFTERFPTVAHALEKLPDETLIDGEIVAFDRNGRASFNQLQNHARTAHSILFYAFDLLVLAGEDVRGLPLEERRDMLRLQLISKLGDSIRYSETFDVPAAEFVETVRAHGLEGVVAKRRASPYRSGDRSADWLKLRLNQGQEFVIGGYIPRAGSFDSLLVGIFHERALIFAARVRAGFNPVLKRLLFEQFPQLATTSCPFRNLPERTKGRWGDGLTAEDMHNCRWLKPKLVAVLEFLEWTPTNHLRHPKFVALRTDRDPLGVVREQPVILR
jgi:DNA ligase D-like protein (predicted ligase)